MAISPIDGRYTQATSELQGFFSEFALIKYRVWVEVEYFIALSEIPLPQLKSFKSSHAEQLRAWVEHFSEQDALAIKETEKITNHDVKAVEYSVKAKLDEMGLSEIKEFVHTGTLPGSYPKVQLIFKSIEECISGVTTDNECFKAIAKVTGEYKGKEKK